MLSRHIKRIIHGRHPHERKPVVYEDNFTGHNEVYAVDLA